MIEVTKASAFTDLWQRHFLEVQMVTNGYPDFDYCKVEEGWQGFVAVVAESSARLSRALTLDK